jgi:hypothetical protein
MTALRMTIPITKVDAARRLVYGVATAEIEDRAGEICDYASTKPLYEKWSEAIAKSSGGKSLGNLRAMHGAVAAGKVTALTFNDEARQIEICAKVIDDAEWIKVEEGVYTGFSQGGTYARRWTDASGAKRYTADPHEISLVDLPCLSEARFEMVKADGSTEYRKFKLAPAEPVATVAEAPPAPRAQSVEKIGARNSAEDLDRIQTMHDTAVELGATCGAHKVHMVDLTKQFDILSDRLMKTLSDLATRIKAIEDEPRPMPLATRARAVSKQEDAGLEEDGRLDRLLSDPNALSLLAIKLAQRQGDQHRR